MRYFIELAYNGANYNGWQRQPNDHSVQETIEKAFATILRSTGLEIVGCGRTDAGVHASQYFAHFDFAGEFPPHFVDRSNRFLPDDIAIRRVFSVSEEHHARFDANYRAYAYYLSWEKDPFRQQTLTYERRAKHFDQDLLQAAAQLLLPYQDFTTFCKTGSDAKTMNCELYRSEWEFREYEWVYHIAANRFLRGMVRLIVGMCLSVAAGKLSIADVQRAMDQQQRLHKSLSVAPDGLYLAEVRYPFL
jgi:tRNA pseudouridine38-40 synthase